MWFYEVAKDGETLDAKRNSRPQENDLWDLTLKYRRQFEESAPAFVDGDTWKQWQTMEPKRRSISYARPVIETEIFRAEEPENREIRDKAKKVTALFPIWWKRLREVQEQQPIKSRKLQLWLFEFSHHILSVVVTFQVDIYEGLETEELTESKNWSASTDDLSKNNHNLSAGRYKPLTLTKEKYDPPTQIISELQNLESTIQSKLNSLLSMIEGKK